MRDERFADFSSACMSDLLTPRTECAFLAAAARRWPRADDAAMGAYQLASRSYQNAARCSPCAKGASRWHLI